MRAHHRVRKQDQYERRRHDDAESAGHADQRRALFRRHSGSVKAREHGAAKRGDARADRTVHRCQQYSQAQSGERCARAGSLQCPARRAKQRLRERQMIEQCAHQDVEGQRLQKIVFEQAQDPRRDRREYRQRKCADEQSARAERDGHTDQHDPRGQPRRDQRDRDGCQHPQPRRRHQGPASPRARKTSTTPCKSVNSASINSASFRMK